MQFHELSVDQRRSFHENGYLVVPGALDADTVAKLADAGDELIASNETFNRTDTSDYYDGFRNVVTMHDAFIPLITREPVLPYIVQLLGIDIHLVTSHLIYKKPAPKDTPTTTRHPGWHRDIDGTVRAFGHDVVPRLCIKCAYYLEDATEPNCGNTMFAPGSHLAKQSLAFQNGSHDPAGAITVPARAGDCVLFENRTWHAAEANLSDRTLKQVMIGYGYRFMQPMDWRVMADHVVELVKDNPIAMQLIGRTGNPGGKFRPGTETAPLQQWADAHGVDYHQYHSTGGAPVGV